MPTPQTDYGGSPNRGAEWITPVDAERNFSHYLEAVWAGRWIVALVVIAAVAGAVVYVETATTVYESHSQLLVTPLPATSGTAGLGLVQQSSDPLRDIETYSSFVTTTGVAERVRGARGVSGSATSLLTHIKVTPIAQSDIIDIAATSSNPSLAKRLADGFATATVADRTAALDSQLDLTIPRLKAQIAALSPGEGAAKAALGAQLAQFDALRVGPDPTVRVQALAALPSSPISPRRTLTVVAGLMGGLVAGIGIVLLVRLLDPRLRREEDLRERYDLPILARVPTAQRRGRRSPLGPMLPDAVSHEGADAFRSLRSVLTNVTGGDRHGRIVLVTGATPLDGKSTTSINLSATLAASNDRVILIEGDIRRPSIGTALEISGPEGVESVLFGRATLEDALVDTVVSSRSDAPHVRVLLANPNGTTSQPLLPSAFREMLTAARKTSDWVIIDSPPLIYAPDLLSASRMVDDVILVVRLGNTNMRNLDEVAEMLAQHHIRPTGFVVVGTSGHPQYY